MISGDRVKNRLPHQAAMHVLDHRTQGTIDKRQLQAVGVFEGPVCQNGSELAGLGIELFDTAVIGEHVEHGIIAYPNQIKRFGKFLR